MFEKGTSKPAHETCYKAQYSRTPKSRPSKYPSTCVLCKGRITYGDSITFLRVRGSGSSAEVEAETTEAVAEASSAFSTTAGGSTATTAAVTPPTATASADGVAGALAAILLPLVARDVDAKISAKLGEIDPTAILSEVDAAIIAKLDAIRLPREVVVRRPDATINVGLQHRLFEDLLTAVGAGCNVWLAGPAGSGKTTAAKNVAKALGLPFYFTGAVGDQYALIGYYDANGRYVRTLFREAFENGGVFLWDEVDGSDPTALLAFQAALANGCMAFPDGVVQRHENCRIIAAANTWGHGATHEYVGRLKLDAAFLDRFGARIAWEYDDALESATAGNEAWCRRVQAIRATVKAKGIRVLVTPRATYEGAKLLSCGMSQDKVEAYVLRSGMTAEQWATVIAACPRTESAEVSTVSEAAE